MGEGGGERPMLILKRTVRGRGWGGGGAISQAVGRIGRSSMGV